jgi:internalin A
METSEKAGFLLLKMVEAHSDFSYVIAESLGYFFEFIDLSLRNRSIGISEEDDVIILSRESGSLLGRLHPYHNPRRRSFLVSKVSGLTTRRN